MIWIGLAGMAVCVGMVIVLILWRKPIKCPECGSTRHEVDRWIHYGHDRPVLKCVDCGNVWCEYPGIEIEEADDARTD